MTDTLYIEGHSYPVQLILLDFLKFDVILGMDCLVWYNSYIDCHKRELVVDWGGKRPVTFRAHKSQMEEAYISILRGPDEVWGIDPVFLVWWEVEGMPVPNMHEIPIVCEYPDVFLEELSGLPRK